MGTDGLSGSSVITINRLFNKLLRAMDGSASITNSVVLPGLSVFRFSFMFRERFSFHFVYRQPAFSGIRYFQSLFFSSVPFEDTKVYDIAR